MRRGNTTPDSSAVRAIDRPGELQFRFDARNPNSSQDLVFCVQGVVRGCSREKGGFLAWKWGGDMERGFYMGQSSFWGSWVSRFVEYL